MNPERRIEALAKAIVDDEYQWNSPDYSSTCEDAMFEAERLLKALDEAEASELMAVRSVLRSLRDEWNRRAQSGRAAYQGGTHATGLSQAAAELDAALDGLSETPEGA